MSVAERIDEASRDGVVRLEADEVEVLIDQAEIIRTDSTGIAGRIRTLRLGGRILVQERNPEHEHFLRVLADEDIVRQFIEKRLADYDRMWDG